MKRRAFTLVEVILAILIISAIMTVLLYFYQRSVEVRQSVLEQAEFLSVSRMLMEQLSTELRAARVEEDQFVGFDGSSNSITFVTTAIPQTARWIISTNEALILPPVTDLKRVTYRLLSGTNIVDVRGVDRTEEILTGSTFTTLVTTNATDFTNRVTTNILSETDTNLLGTNDVQLIRRPLTDRIKLLQFRYWGGTNWLDSWNRLELPIGVEITLGADAAPAETATSTAETAAPDELPPNVFRRVVYLPNSVPAANKPTEAEAVDLF